MLLYPEGIVKLNQTAGEIIRRCDGVCLVAQMVAELQREFPGDDERVAEGTYRFRRCSCAKDGSVVRFDGDGKPLWLVLS